MASTSAAPLKLYTSVICPYAHRAYIALEELGLEYEYNEIDLVGFYSGKPEWFLNLNPIGKVPVIVHEGKNIQESAVVVEYLDEVFGKSQTLLPADPYKRAQAKIWTNYYGDFVSPVIFKILGEADPAKVKEHVVQLNQQLKFLSKHGLQKNQEAEGEQQYFLGKQFTYIDIALIPLFIRAVIAFKQFKGFDLFIGAEEDQDIKKLKNWYDYTVQRKSVQDTSFQWTRFNPALPNVAFEKLGYKEAKEFNFEQLVSSVYERFAKSSK